MCVLLLPLPGDAADIALRLDLLDTFPLPTSAVADSPDGDDFIAAANDSSSCSDFVRARPSVEFTLSIPSPYLENGDEEDMMLQCFRDILLCTNAWLEELKLVGITSTWFDTFKVTLV